MIQSNTSSNVTDMNMLVTDDDLEHWLEISRSQSHEMLMESQLPLEERQRRYIQQEELSTLMEHDTVVHGLRSEGYDVNQAQRIKYIKDLKKSAEGIFLGDDKSALVFLAPLDVQLCRDGVSRNLVFDYVKMTSETLGRENGSLGRLVNFSVNPGGNEIPFSVLTEDDSVLSVRKIDYHGSPGASVKVSTPGQGTSFEVRKNLFVPSYIVPRSK